MAIFFGSWSCKKCNHLNRKSSHCKKCKTKKKHSLIKEKKERMNISLSVKRWICGHCGNRNAVQLTQCDNCKKEKAVAPRQYQAYHQNTVSPKRHKAQNNDKNDDL